MKSSLQSPVASEPIPTRKELVLQAIRSYRASHHGISPTVRDLIVLTGITSSSVVLFYLGKLAEEKAIIRYHGIARGIVLVERA